MPGIGHEIITMYRGFWASYNISHFLPDISAYTGPLTRMTMNGTSFYWKPRHEKCLQMIKVMCCQMPVLHLIQPMKDEPIWVICNTSVYGVGAMCAREKPGRPADLQVSC